MQFTTMEGFNTMAKVHTMEMGFNVMVRSVNPNYRLVGFDLDEGGNQVGALNVGDNFLCPEYNANAGSTLAHLYIVCRNP